MPFYLRNIVFLIQSNRVSTMIPHLGILLLLPAKVSLNNPVHRDSGCSGDISEFTQRDTPLDKLRSWRCAWLFVQWENGLAASII